MKQQQATKNFLNISTLYMGVNRHNQYQYDFHLSIELIRAPRGCCYGIILQISVCSFQYFYIKSMIFITETIIRLIYNKVMTCYQKSCLK